MYLFILDFETGNIDVIRNLPENIEDIEYFVEYTLGYKLSEVSYMLVDPDDSIFNILDFNNNDDTLTDRGYCYISEKF